MTLTPEQQDWIEKQPDAQTLMRKLNEKKVDFSLYKEIMDRYQRMNRLKK